MKYVELQDKLQNLTGLKISQSKIGEIIGTSRQNIGSKFNNPKSEVSVSELQKIEKFYNVSLYPTNANVEQVDCIDIPVRGNLTASMGAGVEVIDETATGYFSVGLKLLHDVGACQQFVDMVPCEGDSMFPTIEAGSLLLVDRSKTEVFDGKIYCIRLNNKLIAKRLQFIPPNKVKVISDNKDKYDAFYVDFSKELEFDFAIIGEVKWWSTVAR